MKLYNQYKEQASASLITHIYDISGLNAHRNDFMISGNDTQWGAKFESVTKIFEENIFHC